MAPRISVLTLTAVTLLGGASVAGADDAKGTDRLEVRADGTIQPAQTISASTRLTS